MLRDCRKWVTSYERLIITMLEAAQFRVNTRYLCLDLQLVRETTIFRAEDRDKFRGPRPYLNKGRARFYSFLAIDILKNLYTEKGELASLRLRQLVLCPLFGELTSCATMKLKQFKWKLSMNPLSETNMKQNSLLS